MKQNIERTYAYVSSKSLDGKTFKLIDKFKLIKYVEMEDDETIIKDAKDIKHNDMFVWLYDINTGNVYVNQSKNNLFDSILLNSVFKVNADDNCILSIENIEITN